MMWLPGLIITTETEHRDGPDAVDGRIVAELAIEVPTPTLRAAILSDSARVCPPRADAVVVVVAQALDDNRGESIRSCAVAELPISVAAPALCVIHGKGARMQTAAGDSQHLVTKPCDLDGCDLELRRRPTAKLTVLV